MDITKILYTNEESIKRRNQELETNDDGLFLTKKSKRETLEEESLMQYSGPFLFHYKNIIYQTDILEIFKDQPEFLLQNLNHNIKCFQGIDKKMPVIGVLGMNFHLVSHTILL